MIRTDHPVALVVTIGLLIAAAVVLDPGLLGSPDRQDGGTTPITTPTPEGTVPVPDVDLTDEDGRIVAERLYEDPPQRITRKRGENPRAVEIQQPTGYINADSVDLSQYVGRKVVLVEFWTFGCYNCQNTHPHIKEYWRNYRDEGLVVVGVHYPEFDYEANPANVREYVEDTNTTYPVVLDNQGATWSAYDQRYWPTRYLIGVDGFVRYKHIGEGGYEETDERIRELLAERDRVVSQRLANGTAGG